MTTDDLGWQAGSAGLPGATERRKAVARFRDAVHELAGEPTPANAVRYLMASRALDEARSEAQAAA